MRPVGILYTALIAAAVLLGVAIPLLVHAHGGGAVSGWQDLVNPGALSDAHRPFGDTCETCHTPHAGVEPRTCIACHAATSFGDNQSTRFHAAAGQCTSCHFEHEGNAGVTRMDHDALLVGRFWTPLPAAGQQGAPPSQGTDAARAITGTRPGGAQPSLDCASCHSNRDPHRGLFGAQCSACHLVTAWTVAGFRHPPPSSTQCAQCHQPPRSHLMEHFEMVSQRVAGERARVEQCFACHTTDSWNNIRRVGFYDHH